ncbi:MAG TPA: sigma-70 family RNA polymerase sigma factor [Gemmataceae bacterium]|nr:sigma-70 family RNA polymerase sigma factor [Gemmataceae bacterium]
MAEAPDDSLVRELARGGNEEAARRLFDEYVDRLLALARGHISQRLARRVDAEDVVQSVFRTFFGRLKDGRFHIQDRDDLGKLLTRITVHKVLRQVSFHRAAKRSPMQEAGAAEWDREDLVNLLTREPSPEMTIAFLDQLEHFIGQLRPQEREILELRLQEYNNEEIARRLGTYERRVRRVLERIRAVAAQEGFTPPPAAP